VKAVEVNGYEMAYVERGVGIPVIFVHGSGVDYRYFAAQMEPFGSKYRAISISLRHHYPEPWRGDGGFSLNQHAADLVAFIQALGAGPVHLVGHSRGATAALYTTRMAPHLIRSLTIAEGGAGMPAFSADDPAVADRRATAFRTMTAQLSKGDTDGGLKTFMEFVGGPGAWEKTPDPARQVLRDNAWTLAMSEADTASWQPFSCEDVRRINVPVLLLGGDASPATFGATLDKLQSCLAKFQRQVMQKTGHAMPRVNPSGFNSAVLSFIAAQ
jgi:pimeloyl-ACP methyl ester carboxylesterase